MCGINGFNFVNKKLIKKMNDSLKHRGPDAEGTFIDKKASLGHRRLAIIDLSKKANQPMIYSHNKRKAIIVYNGEIYNFKEIRKKLEKKGYKFKTNSDTEVILASYLEWGASCVNKFNGMWAFCIYDSKKNIFFLSRDRLGQKPLYYYNQNKKFIFSSEIKGILKHKIKKELNKNSIDLYFSLGFIPAPYSIYKDIKKLEAGYNLIFDLKNKKLNKKKYFFPTRYSPIFNKKKLINEGKKLMRDSTKMRLISEVPLGAFLSGGVDSSSIVSEITNILEKKNLITYSMGFEGNYDETKYIKLVAKSNKVKNHHNYFKKKELNQVLETIFYYFDEPLCDPSMFPTFLLSKFAKESLTVSLSGDGGDELFGGYPRYKLAAQMKILRKIPKIKRKILHKLISNNKKFHKLKEGIRLSLLPEEKFYSEARKDVYKPQIYKEFMNNKFKKCLRLARENFIEAIRLMDTYYLTLADNYLTKVDRAAMANSLEVRSPFLDYRFLEFSSKIPQKWKTSFSNEKILLKKIVKKLIPKEIIKRKKQGFTPPLEEWLSKEPFNKELIYGLNNLNKKKIVDDNWKEFYFSRILSQDDQVARTYKVRLFVLIRWVKRWIK